MAATHHVATATVPAVDPVVSLQYQAPAADLRRHVSDYQFATINTDADIRDLHNPTWAIIRFSIGRTPLGTTIGHHVCDPMPSAALIGVTSKAPHIRVGTGRFVSAGLFPLGWADMFDISAARFANRVTPLADLVGDDARRTCEALDEAADDEAAACVLDEFFRRHIRPREHPIDIPRLQTMLTSGEHNSADSIADELGVSRTQLRRLTKRYFGLSPKTILKRQRFLRTLMALREPSSLSWGQRLDDWYHDHSHFVRDCHAILGMTPRAFLSMHRPLNEASMKARVAALGVPAQALDARSEGKDR